MGGAHFSPLIHSESFSRLSLAEHPRLKAFHRVPPGGFGGNHTHSIDQRLLLVPAKLLTYEAGSIIAILVIKLRLREVVKVTGPAFEQDAPLCLGEVRRHRRAKVNLIKCGSTVSKPACRMSRGCLLSCLDLQVLKGRSFPGSLD